VVGLEGQWQRWAGVVYLRVCSNSGDRKGAELIPVQEESERITEGGKEGGWVPPGGIEDVGCTSRDWRTCPSSTIVYQCPVREAETMRERAIEVVTPTCTPSKHTRPPERGKPERRSDVGGI